VYLANMFQVYPEDRGQNYSVKLANRVASQMLEGARTRVSALSHAGPVAS
jgi:hypothetical protein